MRDNGQMTSAADTPTASRQDAIDALGISGARTRIIRLAVRNGRVTAQEIMDDTGLSRSGIQKHLVPLVQAGILTPDTVPEHGVANRLVWSLNREELDRFLAQYRATLLGGE